LAAWLAPVGTVHAQQNAFDLKSAAHIRDQYLADLDTVHVKILALAGAIPADKYSWRPAQGVRSVSEVLMHVTEEWYYYGPLSVGGRAPADYGSPREASVRLAKVTAKADVIEQLNKSWVHCSAQISSAGVAQLLGSYKPWNMPLDRAAFVMTGDQHEHLGQLIAYARSIGVTPPWSK
jgi:uncharacterized damage-inducible protein DinB